MPTEVMRSVPSYMYGLGKGSPKEQSTGGLEQQLVLTVRLPWMKFPEWPLTFAAH